MCRRKGEAGIKGEISKKKRSGWKATKEKKEKSTPENGVKKPKN